MLAIAPDLTGDRSKRRCQCGCGQSLPDGATRRRKYIDATHRQRAHTARHGKKKTVTSGGLGKIYFIQRGEGGPIKIGISYIPKKRLADLQIASPEPLRLLGAFNGHKKTERKIHDRFKQYRIGGEWFEPADEILQFIEEKCGDGNYLSGFRHTEARKR